MARRRDYAAEYQRRNALARERGYRSYGELRYKTQTKPKLFADLEQYQSWRKATRNRRPTAQVADWYRKGFLKTGEADAEERLARASFLSWVDGTRRGRGMTRQQIRKRAKALGGRVLGILAQPDFDWNLWRADYEESKTAG